MCSRGARSTRASRRKRSRKSGSRSTTQADGQVPEGEVLEAFQESVRTVRRPDARAARRGLQGSGRELLGAPGVAAAIAQPRLRSLAPQQTNVELHLSHWSGELPVLEAYSNWTYDGEWQGI